MSRANSIGMESNDPQDKETVLLLEQSISKMARMQRKVLAMYYFENRTLADIAASLGQIGRAHV